MNRVIKDTTDLYTDLENKPLQRARAMLLQCVCRY